VRMPKSLAAPTRLIRLTAAGRQLMAQLSKWVELTAVLGHGVGGGQPVPLKMWIGCND